MRIDKAACGALRHLITPAASRWDVDAKPAYYCCVNAGVASVHLKYVPACRDRCLCHGLPENWRPRPGGLLVLP